MQTKRHLFQLFLFAFTILNSSFFILNSAALAAGPLPDTGQSKCYNSSGIEIPCSGTGQDGAYSGYPMWFTDNANGTVTDNNTGLVWQRCSMGQNNDPTCSGTAAIYNWYQAFGTYHVGYNPSTVNICGSLFLAGTGWRLPSKKELVGIVDYSIPYPGPTILQAYFPATVSSNYWSSTTDVQVTYSTWYVSFVNGSVYVDTKDDTYYVRCVRGGQ